MLCRVFTEKQHPGRARGPSRGWSEGLAPSASLLAFIDNFLHRGKLQVRPRGSPPPREDARAGERMPAPFWRGNGANGGRGSLSLSSALLPPSALFFPPLLCFLVAPHCSEVRMVDVNCRKGSSKGQQVLNGEDGYFFFTVAGTSGVAFPHQL